MIKERIKQNKALVNILRPIFFISDLALKMNDDENFIIEKVTALMDRPKHTGAIPRNMTQSTYQMPTNYWDTAEKINNGLRVCVVSLKLII